MNRDEFIKRLTKLKACSGAMKWVEQTEGTPGQLWEKCETPDHLLWLAGETLRGKDIDAIALASCDCARTALQYVPAGEERPRLAIEAAEAFIRGDITVEQLSAAMYAARYAAMSARYAAMSAAESAADKEMCQLIRKRVTWSMIEKGLKK